MANSVKHPETIRVLAVFEDLLKRGIVKNSYDFCQKLPYAQSTMSKIEKGERRVPVNLLHLMARKLKVIQSGSLINCLLHANTVWFRN